MVFPKEGITIFGKELYFPYLEEILTKEEFDFSVAQHLIEMEENLKLQQLKDSLAQTYQDSLNIYNDFFQKSRLRFDLPNDDFSFFDELFEAWGNSERDTLSYHILHYGDSQIEGDRITALFRQKMQERFGGQGAGLIPALQVIPTFSVGQTADGSISRYLISGMHAQSASHRKYGLLGQFGDLNGNAMISVSSRSWKQTYDNVKEFTQVRVFVGKPEQFILNLTTGGKTIEPTNIQTENGSRIYQWKFAEAIKKFSLSMSGSAYIYGMSMDGDYGLTVDNIPFRGSSGTFFTSIDSASMGSMMRNLRTNLVFLQFGGNTVPVINGEKSINDYKERMAKQIRTFQNIYPEAKIVLIGPSDMTTKVNGRLQTYPWLARFIKALKETAVENNAGYWDLYQVMGGENSMIAWVNNSLASSDYIHLNTKGSNKIAELLFESMMLYHDFYLFKKNHKEQEDSLIGENTEP